MVYETHLVQINSRLLCFTHRFRLAGVHRGKKEVSDLLNMLQSPCEELRVWYFWCNMNVCEWQREFTIKACLDLLNHDALAQPSAWQQPLLFSSSFCSSILQWFWLVWVGKLEGCWPLAPSSPLWNSSTESGPIPRSLPPTWPLLTFNVGLSRHRRGRFTVLQMLQSYTVMSSGF